MSGEEQRSVAIRGVVVTHGKLAEELVRTVELIVGGQKELFAISGSDRGPEELVASIRKVLSDRDNRPTILFVDYFGGSSCINCVRAADGEPAVKILSGVNLPILLSFVTKRDSLPFEQLVDHLVRRGRESVKLIGS